MSKREGSVSGSGVAGRSDPCPLTYESVLPFTMLVASAGGEEPILDLVGKLGQEFRVFSAGTGGVATERVVIGVDDGIFHRDNGELLLLTHGVLLCMCLTLDSHAGILTTEGLGRP